MLAVPPREDDASPLARGLHALAARGEPKRYRKGMLLIQEGDTGTMVYVILSGQLRAFGSNPVTDREVEYDVYGPGDLVGEMGLDGGPRSASVVVEETCECAVISHATLQAYCREDPDFALELLKRVIGRARAATRMAKQMVLQDAWGRLRDWLDARAVPQPDGTRLVSPAPTHRRLGERLGCTRERVTIILNDLEGSGHLRKEADDSWRLLGALPPRLRRLG